jgi:hypothetical protein
MRPVGKVGCDVNKAMADVHTREDVSLMLKPEKKRERECACVCGKERWRKRQVVRTEATVVRGGLQDQD